MQNKLSERGFTLVELIAVIAILGIVAALAIPKIGDSMAQSELDSAARGLAADLRLLQQMSVNSAGGTLPTLIFGNVPPYSYVIAVNSQTVKRVYFPASVVLKVPAPAQVQFNYNGWPVNGSNYTVTLSSTRSGITSRQVIIEAKTGRVRIQ